MYTKIRTFCFMLGIISVSFLSTAFATCTKMQVEQANAQWANAIASQNVNKVVDLYDSHAVLLATIENKPIVTEKERVHYFTHFFEIYKNAHVKYKGKQYIQVFTGGAVSSGLYTFYGKKQGKNVVVPARYIFVYLSTKDGCRLITHHSSLLPN